MEYQVEEGEVEDDKRDEQVTVGGIESGNLVSVEAEHVVCGVSENGI